MPPVDWPGSRRGLTRGQSPTRDAPYAAFQAEWPIDSLLVWDKGNNGPGDMSRLRNTYELAAQFSAPGFQFVTGSGSSLVAAKAAGIRAVGIEIEERYCEKAAERCRQDTLGLSFLPGSVGRSVGRDDAA